MGLAFGLSSIPVLAGVGFLAVLVFGSVGLSKTETAKSDGIRKKMQPVNPLLWTIWSATGDLRYPPVKKVPVEQVLQAVAENPGLVNTPVAPYGTPLKVAVTGLSINSSGTPNGDIRRQEDMMRVVRALVAQGARFGPDEGRDLRHQWLLKRALHEGPVTTATENPLVWRILTRQRGRELFTIRTEEIPFLNQGTQLHGTPLYAALLADAPDVFRELINAGARLSEDEEREPAAAASLEKMFERAPELRIVYRRR
jgi:hypothetical protein